MIRRTLALTLLCLGLAAPAALADTGAPATVPAAAAALPGKAPIRQLRLLRLHVRRVATVIAHRCKTGGAEADRCKAAAQKLAERLQKLDGRIDDGVAKLQQRCSSTTDQTTPKVCTHLDQVVARLHALQDRIHALEQKLQPTAGG
jgi:polyhydroxyalkanoate synthesis regulator phasin